MNDEIAYIINNIKVWAQSVGNFGEENDKELGKAILIEVDKLKEELNKL